MIRDNDVTELEAALPLMTPAEQAEALAILEEDRRHRFLSDMPQDVLDAVCDVCGAVALSRGAERAPISPHPTDVYRILGEDGKPRPYDAWCHRATGEPLTARERSGIGPLTRWTPRNEFDPDPWAEEVLALLPEVMRERVRQAIARGQW